MKVQVHTFSQKKINCLHSVIWGSDSGRKSRSFKLTDLWYVVYAPLAEWLRRERGPVLWLGRPPSPTHNTCLLCSAMSALMKLAYLLVSLAGSREVRRSGEEGGGRWRGGEVAMEQPGKWKVTLHPGPPLGRLHRMVCRGQRMSPHWRSRTQAGSGCWRRLVSTRGRGAGPPARRGCRGRRWARRGEGYGRLAWGTTQRGWRWRQSRAQTGTPVSQCVLVCLCARAWHVCLLDECTHKRPWWIFLMKNLLYGSELALLLSSSYYCILKE